MRGIHAIWPAFAAGDQDATALAGPGFSRPGLAGAPEAGCRGGAPEAKFRAVTDAGVLAPRWAAPPAPAAAVKEVKQ